MVKGEGRMDGLLRTSRRCVHSERLSCVLTSSLQDAEDAYSGGGVTITSNPEVLRSSAPHFGQCLSSDSIAEANAIGARFFTNPIDGDDQTV